SWMIGSLKPKAINFIGTCTRLGVLPEDCLFVDDSLKNVEAAKAGGFKTIHFESVDQLKEELSALLKE
ncbi:MAG: HAD-IA family hydrolase, partial [Candidatus Diapherotrites archaeon]|nr:HAD-IA family hydrolase [Candidatus Diapherotrites archaeon]